MNKDFQPWFSLKSWLHNRIQRPYFNEGEIWWTSIGTNIGVEIDGKNKALERPVLVFKKFNKESFWAFPATSGYKEGIFFYFLKTETNEFTFILSQIRLLDAKRLKRRIQVISKEDHAHIEKKFLQLIKAKPPFWGGISGARRP